YTGLRLGFQAQPLLFGRLERHQIVIADIRQIPTFINRCRRTLDHWLGGRLADRLIGIRLQRRQCNINFFLGQPGNTGSPLRFATRLATKFAVVDFESELTNAVARDIKNIVAGFRIIAESLEVVLDTGDRVSERIHGTPLRLFYVIAEQPLADVVHALAQNLRRTIQANQVQAATYRRQPAWHICQVALVPLRCNKLDNAVLCFLETGTTLANYRLASLLYMIRRCRQNTARTLTLAAIADH